jgi:DNA-binding protein Fis
LGLATAGQHEDSLHAKIVDRVEREVIAQVMAECDNVQIKAAKRLGINRNTLHKKLAELGMEVAEHAAAPIRSGG